MLTVMSKTVWVYPMLIGYFPWDARCPLTSTPVFSEYVTPTTEPLAAGMKPIWPEADAQSPLVSDLGC